jgi:hypothetical protein
MGTSGFADTFSAPGAWLRAYSMNGRASITRAVRSARILLNSSVDTSGVFWLGSSNVPWKMLVLGWAATREAATMHPSVTDTIRLAAQFIRM